jgi:hypothetical protein
LEGPETINLLDKPFVIAVNLEGTWREKGISIFERMMKEEESCVAAGYFGSV